MIDNDYSPARLAEVFGQRALREMARGRDPYTAARLAGSFAARELHTLTIVTGLRGPVIGAIYPDCPTCDGAQIPEHACPGLVTW